MRSESGPISFEAVSPADYPLLRDWLSRPHWRQWWGDPAEEFALIVDMVEGRDSTQPYLFSVDGRKTGYIQTWFVGHHQGETWTAEHPWLAALPCETVGVDLSIGEEGDLGRGFGSETLRCFVERLVAEGRREIIIDPDPDNERAVRCYTRAGFRPIPELVGRSGDSLIMKCDLHEYGMEK